MPMPEKECIVMPPILQAAIPVEAVTATASGHFVCSLRLLQIISRNKTDLPLPDLHI